MIEISKVLLILNIDLNELKDISPDSFHWLDHVVISTLVNKLTDAVWVKVVNLNKVGKDLAQIVKVSLADTWSYFLVYFDHEIYFLDDVWVH